MLSSSARRRRWAGAVSLVLAVGMLAGGNFLMKISPGDPRFMVYWLTCLVLTCVAFGCAWADARALRRRIRHEQRALFETTLQEIEERARRRVKG